jgi:hypothetical protein
MAVSLEAFAMAGMDYLEFAVDAEEWEQDLVQPPPHLLVEEEEPGEEIRRDSRYAFPMTHICPRPHAKDDGDDEDRVMDKRMPKWLKSIKLMVTAIIRFLKIIRMKVQKRFKSS